MRFGFVNDSNEITLSLNSMALSISALKECRYLEYIFWIHRGHYVDRESKRK